MFRQCAHLSLQLPLPEHTHTHNCLYMSPSYLSQLLPGIKLNNKPPRPALGTREGTALVIKPLRGGPRSGADLRSESKSSIKPTAQVWQGGSSEAQMWGEGWVPREGGAACSYVETEEGPDLTEQTHRPAPGPIPGPWSAPEPRFLKHSSIWFIIKEYEVYDELSLFYIRQWMKKSF